MRTVTVVPLILALVGLFAAPAFAQPEEAEIFDPGDQKQNPPRPSKDDDGKDDDDKDDNDEDDDLDSKVFYSGFGVERASTPFDNLGAATNLAGVIGFRIPTAPWFGIEIDLGQTLIPGEYRDPLPAQPAQPLGCGAPLAPPCTTPAQPAEKGAYDTGGDEFMMQALGLSLALKTSGTFYVTGKYGYRYLATSNDTLNENRGGNGFAVGVGYRWGNRLSGVELGYKQLGEDVESIGLTFYARPSSR